MAVFSSDVESHLSKAICASKYIFDFGVRKLNEFDDELLISGLRSEMQGRLKHLIPCFQ
jgi:hypothetical protein